MHAQWKVVIFVITGCESPDTSVIFLERPDWVNAVSAVMGNLCTCFVPGAHPGVCVTVTVTGGFEKVLFIWFVCEVQSTIRRQDFVVIMDVMWVAGGVWGLHMRT